MSGRRWWTLPKMFTFPLWSTNTGGGGGSNHDSDDRTDGGAHNRHGSTPNDEQGLQKQQQWTEVAAIGSSDDEDLEEFLEKQRNVRLGYVEVTAPSPAKSNRKYSSSDEKLARSKSRRRSSRSSSKSSGSTKYSSFSKASDTENDKAIKETIYESGASQISFSFFNGSSQPEVDDENQLLYDHIDDATKVNVAIQPDRNDIARENSPQIEGNSKHSAEPPVENIEPLAPTTHPLKDSTEDGVALLTGQSATNCKERHVTKLTILLSSARTSSIDANETPARTSVAPDESCECIHSPPGSTEMSPVLPDDHKMVPVLRDIEQKSPSPGGDNGQGSHTTAKGEKQTEQTNAPHLAAEGCTSTHLGESSSSFVDNVDYVELGEFQQPLPNPDNSEVPGMEYCNHRAKVKTHLRKISLRRKRNTQPSLKTMNVRLNKAWHSLRAWWHEEKSRLSQLRPKSLATKDDEAADSMAGGCSSVPSDKSFYEAIEQRESNSQNSTEDEDVDEEMDVVDEDGYCSLEPRQQRQRRRYSSADGVKMGDNFTLRRKSCVSELGTVRRYPPHPPLPHTAGMNAFCKCKYYPPQGQDGFEDLRRYIKQGGDFCKELSIILQERSEAEIQYAKTLSKLSCKLLKVSKEAVGTVSQAWHKAGIELETTSEIHKTFATALCEEVVKPLKQLLESQHRIRKSVENAVDKTGKNLSEWRAAESKSKKQSFVSARENEKLQDITLDVRLSGGLTGSNKLTASSLHLHQKQGSEKESSKLEAKRKKSEELVKKSDVEYYTYCLRAERARLEWETAVVRGSQCFQALEEERLQQLKHLAFIYWQHCRDIGPKLTQSAVRLKEPIEGCDVSTDIKTIANTKGVEQPVSEQLLPDFYAEHTTLAMNRERRRQALVKVLQLVVQDLERERRGKNGVENLARAFKQSPNFGNDDSQQNVSEKLHHMRFMLTYLEAARYKLSCALAELEGKPKPSHPLASHIHVIRDRQGFQQSILKVPPWVHKETVECTENVESPEWTDRGTADGNSVQPDSDFDEFSSQSSSEKDYEGNMFTVLPDSVATTPSPSIGGKCRALYHYTANLYDELNLQPGDVINIHDKQPDGWWLGELNGVIGIFPATYVEEIS